MARKSAGPGTAAAVAKARKVDTLGPRIDRKAKSSSVSFQATVAVYAGREFLGHVLARDADINARDSAIVFSIAVQCGADPDVIRGALSRDSQGRASGPLGTALDLIADAEVDR